VILGAADLVNSKYKFELVAILGTEDKLFNQKSYFQDIDSKIDTMWWYPRYVNFAVENGIVSEGEYFRPNDKITVWEFNAMIDRTIEFLNKQNEETESSENSIE